MDPRPTGRSLGLVETHGFTAAAAAAKVGEVVSVHVIPRPHTQLEDALPIRRPEPASNKR